MKKFFLVVFSVGILLICQQAFSQLSGFSFSLPIPMPPRIVQVQDNSLSTPPGQPVTVTAKIIVHTPLKIDTATNPITVTWGTQPNLHSATLYYTTNYETGNPPTWEEVTMTVSNVEDRTNIDHTKVYTVTAQIPGQPAGTKVTYAIEAEDTYTNSDGGQGHNIVVERRGKKDAPPGWPNWNDDLSVDVGETGTANETYRYKDQYQQQNIPLPDNLDFLDMKMIGGKESGTDKLFFKLTVQGQFHQGSNDLSAAYAYLVALVTLRRPIFIDWNCQNPPKTNMEGMYGIINLPNATQPPINSVIPRNPSVNCIECAITGSSDYGFVSTLQVADMYPSTGTGTSTLLIKHPFNKLQHHSQRDPGPLLGPDQKGYSLYDPTGYIGIVGSAIVNAMDLNNISFSICDLTNGFLYYHRNKTYTVQTPQTYTVSGTIFTTIHTGNPLDKDTVKNNLKLYNNMGQQVNITPTVSDPQFVSDNGSGGYPKTYKYTYSFSTTAGEYTLKVVPAGYLPDETSFTLSANISNINLKFYSPVAGGDIAGSRVVNEEDLNVLIQNFGKTGQTMQQGDLNGDGKVGLVDFGIMVKNWGKSW